MAKVVLYHLHLSRHVAGMVKGPVKGVPALGIISGPEGTIPSPEDVVACLPAAYRKAFRRLNGAVAQYSRDANGAGAGVHYPLHSSRGKYLNTLYAIPKVVEA